MISMTKKIHFFSLTSEMKQLLLDANIFTIFVIELLKSDIGPMKSPTHSEDEVVFNFELQGIAGEILTITTKFKSPWAKSKEFESRFVKAYHNVCDKILDENCSILVSLIVLFTMDSDDKFQGNCINEKENSQKMLHEYVKTLCNDDEDQASLKTYLMISSITDIKFIAKVLKEKRIIFYE